MALGWLKRVSIALGGATLGAWLVALMEARASTEGGGAAAAAHQPSYLALVLAAFGVLAPFALFVGFGVAAFTIFLEPARMQTLGEHARRLRDAPVLERSRKAALAPLVILSVFLFVALAANLAVSVFDLADQRHNLFGESDAPAVALKLAGLCLALVLTLLACTLAALPPLRRALAHGAAKVPALINPVVTSAVTLVLVLGALGIGIAMGNESGKAGGPLGVFGVVKNHDLVGPRAALFSLGGIAATAYLALMTLSNLRRAWIVAVVAVLFAGGGGAATLRASRTMNDSLPLTKIIEEAPLGGVAVKVLRKVVPRDAEGYACLFGGGGDCDGQEAPVRPDRGAPTAIAASVDAASPATDDAATEPPTTADASGPVTTKKKTIEKDLNVVFITVDTLRPDVGFMGYKTTAGSPTPNLDRLAEKSVVFDRAYAMASYTGKALVPILIGKYPSETQRDGGHFNVYFPSNTFVAERLKASGIRTMGAASHWYFRQSSGLQKGMDVWETSAIPVNAKQNAAGEDETVTSPEVTNAAIKLLSAPENTGGRFFLFLHYFDPHATYVQHGDAPKFPFTGNIGAMRAFYDGEIWFTDKHIGRLLEFISSQPWAENTAIVLTSDHGEAFLEHRLAYHGVEIYEELVRVPLLVYLPGATPHHVPVKRSHVDIAPTLVEMMRATPAAPGELSGTSLVPDLLGEPDDAFDERDVIIDMPDGPNTKYRRALIHGPTPGTKLIHFGGKRYELYDLAKDPDEKTDLSSDDATLRPMLDAFRAAKARINEVVVPAASQ